MRGGPVWEALSEASGKSCPTSVRVAQGGGFMLRKVLVTIAAGVAALALGASSSKAVEIDLGGLTGAAAGCTHAGTDPGLVCGSTLTFTGTAAGTLTATAF